MSECENSETFTEDNSQLQDSPETYSNISPDFAFFMHSALQFANFITAFEGSVGTLASSQSEDQEEILFSFREQHEFVMQFAKHLVEHLIHSEIISNPEKLQFAKELRQYLTRLQMAQCRAASHLGSLWYSLNDPSALEFRSRVHFLTFEQQRKDSVSRLEESIQEINKVMRSLTSNMKQKTGQLYANIPKNGCGQNVDGVANLAKHKNLHKHAHSSNSGSKEEEEILPMLLPNQNYIPSSQLSIADGQGNYSPNCQRMLLPGRIQRIMLPLTSRQSAGSSRSIQSSKCSKETAGACIVFTAIIFCIALAGLIVWLLTNHYSANSKQKMQ